MWFSDKGEKMNEKLRCMTSVFLCQDEKILMLYRQGGRVVNNLWIGSAGGHFEKEELNDPESCVLRELKEELGITENEISDLKLKYITIRRTKGEIRQNYYFFANLKDKAKAEVSSNEGESKWFPLSEIPKLPMPFTAKYVMKHYLEEGMNTEKLYGGIATKECVLFEEIEET